MPRAPYQVLVIPFVRTAHGLRFAVFHRADADMWQWIAGGGEDDETPLQAARREAFEEGGIVDSETMISLQSLAAIPVEYFADRDHWDPTMRFIPEYSFAIELEQAQITLCEEHRCFEWLSYDEAFRRVYWDSNRVALAELQRRIESMSD